MGRKQPSKQDIMEGIKFYKLEETIRYTKILRMSPKKEENNIIIKQYLWLHKDYTEILG